MEVQFYFWQFLCLYKNKTRTSSLCSTSFVYSFLCYIYIMPLQRKLSKRKKITRKSTRAQKQKRKSIKHKTKRRIIGGANFINTEENSTRAAVRARMGELRVRLAAAQAHLEATINRGGDEILNQLNDKDNIQDAHFIEDNTQIRCNYNHNDNKYIIKISYLDGRIKYTIYSIQTDGTLLQIMSSNPESIQVLRAFEGLIGYPLIRKIRVNLIERANRLSLIERAHRLS